MSDKKHLTLIRLEKDCRKLLFVFSDNTRTVSEFETCDAAMERIRELREGTPHLVIRDAALDEVSGFDTL